MNIGAFGSLLKVLALVISAYGLFGIRKMTPSKELTATFFFVLVVLCSIVYSISFSASVAETISQITFLLFLFVVSQKQYTEDDIYFLKQSLVWASRISAIVVFFLVETAWNGRLYLSGTFTENENYIPAYFIAGVVFAVQVILSDAKLFRKIIAFAEIGAYVYLVLGLGSRGGMIALLVSAVTALIHPGYKSKTGQKGTWKKLVFLLGIVLATSVVLKYVNPQMLERFTLDEILASDGTGRYDIWRESMKIYINSNPLRWIFGFGIASTATALKNAGFAWANVMHNCFLGALFELGMIGFVAYTYMICRFCKKAYVQKNCFAFAVILGMVALSLSCSITHFKPYWNIMLFIICQSCTQESPSLSEVPQTSVYKIGKPAYRSKKYDP